MYTFISILIFIVCILLILIVLVQNSKGGGLASNFSASNQIMGVKKTTDFLEKATWTLAVSLLVLCLAAAMSIDRGEAVVKSQLQEELNSYEATPEVPNFSDQKEAEKTEATPKADSTGK
ncbi:MAG: preprotein translocase subunit SecG [Marinifilaceae bacterium]|jgi:preprotein translocase subunit SecG|nr:preprotein translocase subunit SecG [Marinifilaceae bacterium]